MWRKAKKILKIIGLILVFVFIVLIVLFYRFSSPKSDKKIIAEFEKEDIEVYIKHRQFKNFTYRVLEFQKEIDTTIPIIVFIHGSIGSALDFKSYIADNELNGKSNLISYDRVGYGIHQLGEVQESIKFETELLHNLLSNLNKKNVILVGYSYGGPVALASVYEYKKIVLLAPAVYSKVEPMPWILNFYKWKATRWMLPKIWKAASKEKLSHRSDLQKFENNWNEIVSNIVSVHGDKDWVVPIENSFYLEKKFSSQQFELVTLNNAGHGLVWTNFEEIKNLLLQQLN